MVALHIFVATKMWSAARLLRDPRTGHYLYGVAYAATYVHWWNAYPNSRGKNFVWALMWPLFLPLDEWGRRLNVALGGDPKMQGAKWDFVVVKEE